MKIHRTLQMKKEISKLMDDDEEQMPFVFRITEPFAKGKIQRLGFDRRKRESRIYEYAIQRYYMDLIGVAIALVIIISRIYLNQERILGILETDLLQQKRILSIRILQKVITMFV